MARIGWALGALVGSLVGGAGVTALMILGEKKEGKPSELIALGRASARKAGLETPQDEAMPTAGELAWTQGGHLALSAAAGLAYAAFVDEDTPVLAGGLGLGAAFYVLAHVVSGPALGVKAPEWEQEPATIGKHLVVHASFGLVTALGARLGASLSDGELFR